MNRIRFIQTLTATAISLLTLPAWAQTQTLRLVHTQSSTSAYQHGAQVFADEVAKITKGRFKVEVVPGGIPGGEKAMIEQVKAGTLDLALTSTGPMGAFVPDVLITDIPFLFRDYAHARKTMDGAIGAELAEKAAQQGLILLAWAENGFRHTTNSVRPVKSAEDLKGLKLRTMENAVHMQAFRALGAFPEPIAFTELYAALESKKVDGQENPITVITSSGFGKVQKHLSLTAHVYSPAPILIGRALFDKLSEADKAGFRKAAQTGANAMRKRVSEVEKSGIDELRAQGVQVVADVDRASLEAAVVRAAYPQYEKRFGAAAIERVRAVR
jgi:tripartite ATP-independent transporter DctP family solute receptor